MSKIHLKKWTNEMQIGKIVKNFVERSKYGINFDKKIDSRFCLTTKNSSENFP